MSSAGGGSRRNWLGELSANGWVPIPRQPLPFPALVAASRNDPLARFEREMKAVGSLSKEAIQAAYDRFYRGDIAQEFVRGVQEQGGLITLDDLAKWQPLVEEPLTTNYKGIDVYKLDTWTQGPALLQSLNLLENFDLKALGYNSANYIHTVYQAMNLAFADRDQVPARAQVATQEFRLGEAEIDLLTQRTPLQPGDDVLAPTAEVPL